MPGPSPGDLPGCSHQLTTAPHQLPFPAVTASIFLTTVSSAFLSFLVNTDWFKAVQIKGEVHIHTCTLYQNHSCPFKSLLHAHQGNISEHRPGDVTLQHKIHHRLCSGLNCVYCIPPPEFMLKP